MRTAIVLALILTLASCASSVGSSGSRLDPGTAATIRHADVPMVFYREDSGKAAFARNLIHMGPVEINQGGTYRYYLWLGIWVTVVSPDRASIRDGFEALTLRVDGEPMSLDVAGWTHDRIGASGPIYLRPVASAADAYYELTFNQLRRIAVATDVSIQTSGATGRSYQTWDSQKSAKEALVRFLRNDN